jgi:hypothetical protein
MPASLNDNLPDSLKTLRTRPLFVMRLDVRPILMVGSTPAGYRRIGVTPPVASTWSRNIRTRPANGAAIGDKISNPDLGR